MEIVQKGMAGTLESSDIMISIEPNTTNKIEVRLESTVYHQFGEQMEALIIETVKQENVSSAIVIANDKGALDFVIKARVQTALYRAANTENYKWED
ncbi:citrate lyase acyl carrier protein [Clostridium sp. DL1XJH146]